MVINERSEKALKGVHPDLIRVVRQAALGSPFPFIITEGLRTIERQRILFAQKLSRTMNSRHITGHAIDFVPVVDGEITWKSPAFSLVIAVFKKAAADLGVSIVSGGDWRSFKDFPHIELDRKVYP